MSEYVAEKTIVTPSTVDCTVLVHVKVPVVLSTTAFASPGKMPTVKMANDVKLSV